MSSEQVGYMFRFLHCNNYSTPLLIPPRLFNMPSSDNASVSATELHTPSNSPADLQSTLSTPVGTRLTDRQAQHLAIVLDLFQAKGTMAKLTDNFVEDAVYEDLFATCANRDEVGTCALDFSPRFVLALSPRWREEEED